MAITNFLLLYTMMRRYTGHLETSALILDAGKLAVAGAALALVCLVRNSYLFIACRVCESSGKKLLKSLLLS